MRRGGACGVRGGKGQFLGGHNVLKDADHLFPPYFSLSKFYVVSSTTHQAPYSGYITVRFQDAMNAMHRIQCQNPNRKADSCPDKLSLSPTCPILNPHHQLVSGVVLPRS